MSLMQNPVTGSGSLLWPMFTVWKMRIKQKGAWFGSLFSYVDLGTLVNVENMHIFKGDTKANNNRKVYFLFSVKHLVILNFSEKHYQTTMNIDVKRKEIQFVWVNALVLFATIFFPIAIHVYTFWSLRKNNEWSFIYFWYYEDFKINVNYIGNNNQNSVKAEEKMLKQCNE